MNSKLVLFGVITAAAAMTSPAISAGSHETCGDKRPLSKAEAQLCYALNVAGRYVQSDYMTSRQASKYLAHDTRNNLQFLDRASGGIYDAQIFTFKLVSSRMVRGKPYYVFRSMYEIYWRHGKSQASVLGSGLKSLYAGKLYYHVLFK